MPGGRPLKPTALKAKQGTLRKHRTNKREPKLPAGAPPLPADLDAIATAEWRRLVTDTLRMRVLTESDRPVLRTAAEAYSTWQQAEKEKAANGLTYETESTSGARVIKANPACAIASDAARRYFTSITALGLTPAARQKVAAVDPHEETDPGEGYFN